MKFIVPLDLFKFDYYYIGVEKVDMAATIVIGAQWGDEGKGKIIDFLAAKSDFVVRFHGGNNAGHTVKNSKADFILHTIPSGIFNPSTINIISNGVVLDPEALVSEINSLEKLGIKLGGRLYISPRTHLIMPYHKLLDEIYEKEKGREKIGTTKKGIGPSYADKVSQNGLRAGDLLNEISFSQKLKIQISIKNKILSAFGLPPLLQEDIEKKFATYKRKISPFIKEVSDIINQAVDENREVLFEGAQGVFLDNDWGTYPYVTGSNVLSGDVTSGAGLPPQKIGIVVGVAKAYTTRVGEGPFPTELKNGIGNKLREEGSEYGATTGRPRRCGWLDLELLRFAAKINGFSEFAITKLDVLDGFSEIKISTHYTFNDKKISYEDLGLIDMEKVKPFYTTLKGWNSKTLGITKYSDLPIEARKYLLFIEEELGVPITIISTGGKRNETIKV